MKKRINHRKVKNIVYSGRFYTGIALLLIVLPGIIFTKRAVRADGMELLPEEEFQEKLDFFEENQSILSDREVVLMLNNCPLPYDNEDNIWYVAQNPVNRAWEGVLGLSEKDARLYLLDDGYMKKKQESIREGHLFQAAIVKGNEYALTSVAVSGMPVISIETNDSWQPEYPIEDIDNYVFNSETRFLGDITIFHANGNSGTYGTLESDARNVYRIMQGKVSYHTRGNTSDNFDKLFEKTLRARFL